MIECTYFDFVKRKPFKRTYKNISDIENIPNAHLMQMRKVGDTNEQKPAEKKPATQKGKAPRKA